MSSDACICVELDEGPMQTLTCEIRTARKVHKCGECREDIQPGQQYEYFTGVFDDCVSTCKTCLTCVKIRNEYFRCGWYYGEIWSYLHNEKCVEGREDSDDDFCMCPPKASKYAW